MPVLLKGAKYDVKLFWTLLGSLWVWSQLSGSAVGFKACLSSRVYSAFGSRTTYGQLTSFLFLKFYLQEKNI